MRTRVFGADLPSGFVSTYDRNSGDFVSFFHTVLPDSFYVHAIGINFESVVTGVVYEDLNGNGRRDVGEGGLSGYRVWDDAWHRGDSAGRFDADREPSTATAADGSFILRSILGGPFTNPEPRQIYAAPLDANSGYVLTSAVSHEDVLAVAGQTHSGVDFGFAPPTIATSDVWTIRNRVYDTALVDNNQRLFLVTLNASNDRSHWIATTTPAGTTLQNVNSDEFLIASGPWTVGTATTITGVAYWNIIDNADGSIALQNVSNGRYLDGDGGFNAGVDLSQDLLADDGWFVTVV